MRYPPPRPGVSFVRVRTVTENDKEHYKGYYTEAIWTVRPLKTPVVIRNCSKCNKKMPFYCSEKFRLNGNHTRVDIWLIYKCEKCDSTWKLTLKKGIKPHDIPAELFERFINNDPLLAWEYAFDTRLLKQNACEMDYSCVGYTVEVTAADTAAGDALRAPLHIRIQCPHRFELKLSALLASRLGVSMQQLKKMVENGVVTASPTNDIIKYRIRANLEVWVKPPRTAINQP